VADENTPPLDANGVPMIYVQAKSHVLDLAYDEKRWLPADTPELDALITLEFVVVLNPDGEPVYPKPAPARSCCGAR
jgi:hypothetical protein